MTKKYQLKNWLIILLLFFGINKSFSQNLAPGTPIVEEYGRRKLLFSDELDSLNQDGLRPNLSVESLFLSPNKEENKISYTVFPVQSTMLYNSKRPYGYGGFGMHNGRGYEQYISAGGYGRLGFLYLQLQPEFVFAPKQKLSRIWE